MKRLSRIILLCAVLPLAAYAMPTPPAQHPRLYLTAADLPALRAKAQSPLLQANWRHIEEAARRRTDGNLPLDSRPANNDTAVRDAIEAKAFLSVLNADRALGREAVDAMLRYFATLRFDPHMQDGTRELGRAIVTGSLVYDWCHALLSDGEKRQLIVHMEQLAGKMEIRWPEIHGSAITGHTVEAQISRDMLAFGIAVYDEKPAIYAQVAGKILQEFVPARLFFYPAGYHHQGSAYGGYRFGWEMQTTFIFDKLGVPVIYGKQQAEVPYYFLYLRRPDGQLLRDGDDFNQETTPRGKWWTTGSASMLLAGSYYNDPVLIKEALKDRQLGRGEALLDFLTTQPVTTPARDKSTLPLTRYSGSPSGQMLARTGWEDGVNSGAVVAQMKIQEYNFANHQHLDAGSFQLYYKGPLAVQSGIYQGTNGGYGSSHFLNYSQRSIAHNTMLVRDPRQRFSYQGRAIGNDGGQPYPNDGKEPADMQELLGQGYRTGKVLAHGFGPDPLHPAYSYLSGELAQAYGDKVKSFRRSFVFLNLEDKTAPAALLVYDDITSVDPQFRKTWLLHTVGEPAISGAQASATLSEHGYSGKLVNTTLLPRADNAVLHKIGGPGHEYNVEGVNYPQFHQRADHSADDAMWRIELSPKAPARRDRFLNVMQAMDGGASAAAPELLETSELAGARLGNRVVLFSKRDEPLGDAFQLTLPPAGNYMVLITGLAPGAWRVDGAEHTVNADQCLYIDAGAGLHLFTRSAP